MTTSGAGPDEDRSQSEHGASFEPSVDTGLLDGPARTDAVESASGSAQVTPGSQADGPVDAPDWLLRVMPVLRAAWGEPPAHEREYLSDSHLTVRSSAEHRALPHDRPHLIDDAVDWFRTYAPPASPPRRSAVLVLFAPRGPDAAHPGVDAWGWPRGDGPGRPGGPGGRSSRLPTSYDCDVLLTERAAAMRSHAAQVVCPGGHLDPGDDGPIGAALREAREEVGLDASSVQIVGEMPGLYLTPSGTAVIPVLGWWASPHPVGVVDPAEVARVALADLDHLLDPRNRFTVVGPMGYRGPGFSVDGLFVWGFTANLLTHVFELAGIAPAWDESVIRPLPPHLAAAYWPR